LDSLLNELAAHYARVNREKFRSVLPDVTITVNRRLRALTGRVLYDLRLIELSLYHLTQPYGRAQAFSTLEHEMLHLYLDTLGQPPGHTPTFKHLAKQLSIPLWHCFSYPRNRPSTTTYVYRCPCCGWTVRRSRRLSEIQRSACGPCCRAHNHGRFDPRFVVELIETIEEKAAHRPGAQQRPRGPMPGLPHPHRTPCRCAS
jgi:predicted SprT family Zn-dependent metalloprotease